MVNTGSFKTPARRLLFASLAVVIALFVAAMPAYAAKGGNGGGKGGHAAPAPAPVNVTVQLGGSSFDPSNPCAFDAQVSWGGFANGTSVFVRLLDSAGNTLAISPQISSSTGGGWYIFTFTFTGGSGGVQRDIAARGSAIVNGTEAAGPVSNTVSTTCTGPIAVSWPGTVLQLS